MSYKSWISSHFGACMHIATTFDPHRKRQVRVYALPGEFENVGISDGTDAWIAPVIANPFAGQGVDVKAIIGQIREGTFKGPVTGAMERLSSSGRRRILIGDPPPPAAVEAPVAPASTRRRIVAHA